MVINLLHPGFTANLAPYMSIGSAEGELGLLSINIDQVRSRGLDVGNIMEDGVDLKKSQKLGLHKELCTWQDAKGEECMPSSFQRRQWVEPQWLLS